MPSYGSHQFLLIHYPIVFPDVRYMSSHPFDFIAFSGSKLKNDRLELSWDSQILSDLRSPPSAQGGRFIPVFEPKLTHLLINLSSAPWISFLPPSVLVIRTEPRSPLLSLAFVDCKRLPQLVGARFRFCGCLILPIWLFSQHPLYPFFTSLAAIFSSESIGLKY